MKRLDESFNKAGWHFEQIKRNQRAAIYKRVNLKIPNLVYYETIVIQVKKAKSAIIKGIRYEFPDREEYPTNEQFGNKGWCCMTMERAEQYFKCISEGEVQKNQILHGSDNQSPPESKASEKHHSLNKK